VGKAATFTPDSLLVLLVQFSDTLGTYHYKSQYDSLLFSSGIYTRAPDPNHYLTCGSMRDYFYSMSRGQFGLSGYVINGDTTINGIDKINWIDLPYTYGYCDSLNMKDFRNIVLTFAQNQGINLSSLLTSHSLAIIYAGHQNYKGSGGEGYGGLQSIAYPDTLCGIYVVGERSGGEFMSIGLHCHEYAHIIGISEDDYKGSYPYGCWGLMCWGLRCMYPAPQYPYPYVEGTCPAPLTPDQRYRIDPSWVDYTDITSPQNLTLTFNTTLGLSNVGILNLTHKSSQNTDSLFFIENRQTENDPFFNTVWNRGIPCKPDSDGVLVWRFWGSNNRDLIEADCLPESTSAKRAERDAFFGGYKSYLTDFSTPNLSNWPSGAQISDISATGTTMTVSLGDSRFGDLPESETWWSGIGSDYYIGGNLTIPTGKTLTIHYDANFPAHIYLQGNYIKTTGGTFLDGATWDKYFKLSSGGSLKGMFSTFKSSIDNAASSDSLYIMVNQPGIIVNTGETVSIPANMVILSHILNSPSGRFTVFGTLNIAGGVVFDKLGSGEWTGFTIATDGALNVTGGITVRHAKRFLYIDNTSDVSFPTTTSIFEDCAPGAQDYCFKICNCCPLIRNIKIIKSAAGSDNFGAITENGTLTCPNIEWCTIKDAYWGIRITPWADAILHYCVLDSLLDDCIHMQISQAGSVDMAWGMNDVIPAPGKYAIYNTAQNDTSIVYETYFGPNPIASNLFSDSTKVRWSFAGSPFDYGAPKAAPFDRNPFHIAREYEEIKDWDRALAVYEDVVRNSVSTSQKRMAIKQIFKVDDLSKRDFSNVREIIGNELPSASATFRPFLDFVLCEILVKEKNYRQAVSEFVRNAEVYKGSLMELEMLVRAANMYGDYLDDKVKAKEYADRVAAIDPGYEMLEEAYSSAGIEYNPALYEKKTFDSSGDAINTNQNQQQPSIDTPQKEYVTVSPNPSNAVITISYSIKNPSSVKLTIYSINGQKVATLVDGPMSAGAHSVVFNGSRYASGVYFYKFESAGMKRTGKMLLLK
jgi:M6 family metalloprotease-like protein